MRSDLPSCVHKGPTTMNKFGWINACVCVCAFSYAALLWITEWESNLEKCHWQGKSPPPHSFHLLPHLLPSHSYTHTHSGFSSGPLFPPTITVCSSKLIRNNYQKRVQSLKCCISCVGRDLIKTYSMQMSALAILHLFLKHIQLKVLVECAPKFERLFNRLFFLYIWHFSGFFIFFISNHLLAPS